MTQLGKVEAQRLDDLLDQRGAEVHACETGLAVGDRIEHGSVGPFEVELGRAGVEQRRKRGRDAGRQRDLHEHERLVRHRGMEERVATPVGVEPVLQVVPRPDRVHRLVRDELLEQRRRRIPRDPAQFEQPHVEERRELRLQLAVEVGEIGVVIGPGADDPQHVGAEIDEELHAAFEPAEQPQQPVRGRNERVAQIAFGDPPIGSARQRRNGFVDGVGIGPEVDGEHAQEVASPVVGKRDVRVGDGRGFGALGHRVVQTQELA